MRGGETTSVVAAILAVLVVCTLFVAPVSAGDSITIFYFEPTEVEANPGEEVTLELLVSDHGDYSGDGLGELGFVVNYDPGLVTVTDVESEEWLGNDGSDPDVESTIDINESTGTITVEETREPPGDGTTGNEPVVSITLEVPADATPSTATLSITDAEAIGVSGYPQGTVERSAEVLIDGGEPDTETETEQSAETDDTGAISDEPAGVTLADDAGDSEQTEAAEETGTDADSETTAESTAAFGIIAALFALVAVVLYRQR